ncbi:MAG TPA: geranylgeranylglycerol-phosphate geranylgeranyltransferase [Candidatus Cloacimonadota bacterium]|nr:geranylgeranylglycerol-phosphate geranylgeranyltransferase [Candidatus Cloacimonadota bacterium]HOD54007.1 geranylgeranylglycerol-phosphate geranylgeranyltransferase [Candidatus Cloacimonadota bacterium]HPM02241.1 geranylgeranylglycerol-phosphate geranylgeranyltransferase [Candidatus Cloacimonadota bacterium]
MGQIEFNSVNHSIPEVKKDIWKRINCFFYPFLIIRPFNCLFSFICTYFGAVYSGASPLNSLSYLLALSASLIAGAGYVINDICDIEIDKINQPHRILPSGKMSLLQARYLTLLMGFSGIIISLFSPNYWHLIIASANLFLLFMYAVSFKKRGLSGNLIVAWSAASTFLYGALSSTKPIKVLPIMVFAFLYTIIREWTKTIEDYEGDKSQNAKTLAVVLGKDKVAKWIIIPIALIFSSIFIFYFTKLTNAFVFIMLNVLVFIPLVFFLIVLNRSQHPQIVRKIHHWMKLDMFVLLLIFFTSYLFSGIY